jgi:hypothetical protein
MKDTLDIQTSPPVEKVDPQRRVTIAITVAAPQASSNRTVVETVLEALQGGSLKVLDAEAVQGVLDAVTAPGGAFEIESFEVTESESTEETLYSAIAGVATAALANGCREHPVDLVRDLRKAFLGPNDAGA